jgi:hypothetical protein
VSPPKGKRLTQRGEEPSVLAAGVALLQDLLDGLLGILALADLLEGVGGDAALEALELEGVAGGHEVVVVDNLNEGLNLGPPVLASLAHAAGDLLGVALDAGDDGVAEGVRLVAVVDGLDDDHLLRTLSLAIHSDHLQFPYLPINAAHEAEKIPE